MDRDTAMSTSGPASQSEPDAASISGSDNKKRNKLGYHRTAVACGHCRRRKIRCIPSADTTESRCQNCIRLKKECQFYTIDQTGVNARKARSSSKGDPPATESRSRSTPSPHEQSSKPQGLYDVSPVGDPTAVGPWTTGTDMVASPHTGSSADRMGALHATGEQGWNVPSAQSQMETEYTSHDPQRGGGAYWISSEDATSMAYNHHFVPPSTTTYLQDAHAAYDEAQFAEARHGTGRQSFSGISSAQMNTAPTLYRNYSTTFPEMERSMTMPVTYNPGSENLGINLHMHTQQGHGAPQFAYGQTFPSQLAHENAGGQWFSPTMSQQNFSPRYLPSQRDQSSGYPHNPG